MKDNNFSFLKLRDEIIHKSGIGHTLPLKEATKKLKFEPNLNIARQSIQNQNFTQKNIENEPQQEEAAVNSNVVNLTEISSRFSNKDSLNLIKKPIPKKDKKTIIMSAESYLNSKPEETKEKNSKGENLLAAINSMKIKDATSYLPTTLPFKFLEDESQTLDLNENDQYLFQFPRILPTNLDAQKKIKDEELLVDEPTYDQSGYLIKSEFENMFKKIPKNSFLGKLKIYKSGKIKLQMGNTMYDVTAGINCKFAQELGVIFPQSQEAFFLGKVREKKLIVTPELNLEK